MAISEEDKQTFRRRVVGRSIGEDTFTAYWLWIERFESWFADRDSPEPSLRDLEDFDSMLEDPDHTAYLWENAVGRRAPASYSYSSRVQAISGVKKWVRRHYGVKIPERAGDIALGEEESFEPTYLTRERVRGVIGTAEGDCANGGCAAALALSYDAILRASELARLNVSDISLEEGDVAVTASKGSRDSTLGISERTADYLSSYLTNTDHSTGALFRNNRGERWDKSAWASHVLNYHVPEGSHAWGRHTPILHMFQSGSVFGDVYRRARHKSPSTTARYARYVDADIPQWAEME